MNFMCDSVLVSYGFDGFNLVLVSYAFDGLIRFDFFFFHMFDRFNLRLVAFVLVLVSLF